MNLEKRAQWLMVGLAALTLSAALADTCLPVKHSRRAIVRWATWRAAHPKWHPRKLAQPIVCAPPAPATLPPPPFEPFPVDDQEHLVDLIENNSPPPAPPAQPPLYAEYIYVDWYDWMIPPDIGVPSESGHHGRHRWPHGPHPWRPHRRYSVPEGPTLFMMLAGVTLIGISRRRTRGRNP